MIHVSNVSKSYGPKVLFRDASFQLNPGEKVGLVGPNGNGKTTIFRILMGQEGVDTGTVSKPDKLRMAYFAQDIENMSGRAVLDEVQTAVPGLAPAKQTLARIESLLSQADLDEQKMEEALREYGEAQAEFERLGGYDIESRAAEILTGLGIEPDRHNNDTSTFSGGWKMRIALAKVLIQNPDVLLMDEPTNHLDLESILWLENWIREFPGSLMMTSHDRDFMNRLVRKVVEVSHQRITVFSGNYDYYAQEKALRVEQLKAAAQRQQDMLAKEEEFIARFAARASHAAQVQSRVKKIEKIDRIEVPRDELVIHFEWPTPPRGGDEVVRFESLGKTWAPAEGQPKVVFSGASGLIKRGDRVAVVGVNGAGKSTFLKIVSGQTDPSEGKCQVGAGIELGYFSQNSLDLLHPDSTLVEEVHSVVPQQSLGYVRTLLGALKFSGDEVEKKVRILSGGEKSRVVLAKILARPTNFLVMDEPTNHLDIASREVLLDAIRRYDGTVLIVSHDRHFLRSLATRVFELDKHKLRILDGTYDEYLDRVSARP